VLELSKWVMWAHLDIYVPRSFQWYDELLNPMGFDPYNRFLKIWESIDTLSPKMEAHLGVWRFIPSHSPTFPGAWDVTHGLPLWPTPLKALVLVTNPRLRLRQTKSKATASSYVVYTCGHVGGTRPFMLPKDDLHFLWG
jgi:hypothetical protein